MYEKYYFTLMNLTKKRIISEGIIWGVWGCNETSALNKIKKEKLAKILAKQLAEKFQKKNGRRKFSQKFFPKLNRTYIW